ncbi:protocadherin Fat 4-like [Arapaima gigas]
MTSGDLRVIFVCAAVMNSTEAHSHEGLHSNGSRLPVEWHAGSSLHPNISGKMLGGRSVETHYRSRRLAPLLFSKSVYSFEVREDTPPGSIVGNIVVLDAEEAWFVVYSVLEDDGNGLFVLNPYSGAFSLTRSLDYESEKYYILTVGLHSSEILPSRVRVYFNILDINDNPPVFHPDTYYTSVLEDTPMGECVLTLNVSDEDSGANAELSWAVIGGNEDAKFKVSPSGAVCLQGQLDREKESLYVLTIQVSDCALPLDSRLTSTAFITIHVEDVNDNAPYFLSAETLHISEDAVDHTVVMVVQAVDHDAGSNGHIIYELENLYGSTLSINSTNGRVYLEEPLDRENTDMFAVLLMARDKGTPQLSTCMNLTVFIDDANDNNPAFSSTFYNVTVREDLPRGTSLLRVQAYDPDIGPNGEIRYQLSEGKFQVDSVSGVVSLIDQLDRERSSSHTLTVVAVDQGDAKRSSTAFIHVTVTDINDCAPLFSPTVDTVHVLENLQDFPQIIHQISVTDQDLDVNSQLAFSIDTGNEDDVFMLSPNGTLHILQSLDREEKTQYTLHIIAVDSGIPPLSGTGTILILVDDLNDNHPVFSENVFTAAVNEDVPFGTAFARVRATDRDAGANGEIRYSLEDGDVPFSIDESGVIFTTGALDREVTGSYMLTVIALDKHPTHPLSSSATVSVCVEDVNDHWPRFLNDPYVANIPATLGPGSIICAVSAADADTGLNAHLIFSLFGHHADYLSINPTTGTVFTSDGLEGSNDIVIYVRVEDGGNDPKFDTTTVTIRFQNVSEFPFVTMGVTEHWISEDEPLGTLVSIVSGESLGKGPVSYYLASGNFEDAFQLDWEKGDLTIRSPLDYETRNKFQLCIEVRDSGFPPFSTYAEIFININDVNDNAPVFTQPVYMCELFENLPASFVCKVLAVDADTGIFGKVKYSIFSGNEDKVFAVDADAGAVTTTKSLDREKRSSYTLTIQATDKENALNTGTAIVHITVLDANDHAPRFSQIFLTEVSEDAPVGSTIIQVTSKDEDIGENAVIAYSIINPKSLPFAVDKTTGCVVVIRSLDREAQSRYIIKVNANDSAWSVSTDVTVDVTDINDNRPVFLQSQYSATITETKAQQVFVMQVHATDADVGQNAQILYYIEPPSEIFAVNTSTGDIVTKQPVSFRDSQLHSFTVIASDCGDLPFQSNATVFVTVVPYNHFPPTFQPFKRILSIPYNLEVGTAVIQLSATDQDYHSMATPLEYMVSGGNASTFFEMEHNSGLIRLKRSLGQTYNTVLILTVMVSDKGVPPLSSQTSVSFVITEENHFAPHFSESHVTFSVPEDMLPGFVIGRVHAEDQDNGMNGFLSYAFESGNDDLLFSIGQNTGLITLTGGLDFEKEQVRLLHVSAKDGGWIQKSGEISVTVIVKDVNDNPPVFSATEYSVSVPENSPAGTAVIQTKASDRDSGVNAEITYSLLSGDKDTFSVDFKNGSVTIQEMCDFEVQQTYVLLVKASNTGSSAYFSVVHVYIQITGVNEFTPMFRKRQYSFTISEQSPVGTRVGKVLATDYDLGLEGKVFYLLIGKSKMAGFSVDEHSGEIFTARDLKQSHGQVVLRILAKNTGIINGTDVDETLVQVNVLDANDPPKFYFALYSAEASEDSAVGTIITKVDAEDQDSTLEWSSFFYSIQSGNTNRSFAIDQITGVIAVNSPLDREQWPLYNLTVIAVDSASPPATGSTNVVVVVHDVNDNPPELISTESYVLENQPHGTVVTLLNASDADVPPNQGPFTYRLVKPDLESGFSLTLDGMMSTTRPMDREHKPSYSVSVVIQDAGIPPLSSTATVQVKVLDENDNPSAPRNVYIEVKYHGSTFPGGFIGSVQPSDPDELDQFNCSIKNGPRNMFSFPFGNCELWSSPYKGEATYHIRVEATDFVHASVNNSIYINYKGFTDASINECVLFYVLSSSFEEFLSLEYLKFVKALDSLFNLQASKTHVFAVKVFEEAILLLGAVKSYNGQYLSGEVASNISAAQKKLLEVQSNVEISHITSNPCFMKPCLNGASCTRSIHISQDFGVLESPTVIFVSPRQVEIFHCSCLMGFSGIRCELDIDECNEDPCDNAGTCINYPGGFSCQCMRGFSGPRCSSDVDECQSVSCQNGGTCLNTQGNFHCNCRYGYEGEFCELLVDHCASSPCLQGTCTNVLTGYTCHCPFGVSGDNCEEQSYGFQELSFVEYPPLDPRNNIISLELATVRPNSLLLYNHGGAFSSEFLALELVGGKVCLSYNLGDGVVRVRLQKKVADGLFHSITARRTGKAASVRVDSCSEDEPSEFCFSQTEGIGSERTLDVGPSNMTFGGIKSIDAILLRPTQVRTHDFFGCVRNAKVNGLPLDFMRSLASRNVLESCPRAAVSPCRSGVCLNGGVCRDHWSSYSCLCQDLFTGAHCETEITKKNVLKLNGQNYVEYVIKENYKRELQLAHLMEGGSGNSVLMAEESQMEIKVIVTKSDGFLLSYWGKEEYTALKMKGGKLVYLFGDEASTPVTEMALEATLLDGHWHVLRIYGESETFALSVDGLVIVNTTNPTIFVERILLGGGQPTETRNQLPAGFSGCVEYFKFNGHILPFRGYSEVVDVHPSPKLSLIGCTSENECEHPACMEENIASAPCSLEQCRSEGACRGTGVGNVSCICLQNFTGTFCELCSHVVGNHSICLEPSVGAPLWIIGVSIAAVFLLLILALFITFRRQSTKMISTMFIWPYRFPDRGKQGRDNQAFRCDGSIGQDIGSGGEKQPDVNGIEIQASWTLDPVTWGCSEASQPPLEAGPGNSEPEYYDIDSTCSIFQSNMATGTLCFEQGEQDQSGRQCPLSETVQHCSQDWVEEEMQPGVTERPLEGLRPLNFKYEEQDLWHRDKTCICMTKGHLKQSDSICTSSDACSHPAWRSLLVPDLASPPVGLSAEEVLRLDAAAEQQQDASMCWASHTPHRVNGSSSESETYSSFTCSEPECERELSLSCRNSHKLQKLALVTCSSREGEQRNRSTCSPQRQEHPLSEDKTVVTSLGTGATQHWESLINPGLHFGTYAHVFEDIAALPLGLKQNSDMQSDEEEII